MLSLIHIYRRENTEAAIQRATAALEMAKLNLSYTVVTAPCDGKLGRRTLEEGQFITAGQTITYILPDTQKWIIANYKETQIENLHLGQEVIVTVDAISHKKFTGKITAISGATGSKYSLVPTDNSAGKDVYKRQLLLNKKELKKLERGTKETGFTIVPVRMFVNEKGLAKVVAVSYTPLFVMIMSLCKCNQFMLIEQLCK